MGLTVRMLVVGACGDADVVATNININGGPSDGRGQGDGGNGNGGWDNSAEGHGQAVEAGAHESGGCDS